MTMSTLGAIVAAVQDVVGAVSGVRFAPDVPPDGWPSGVCSLVYPAIGTFTEITAGRESAEHTLHCLVATARANLRSDWATVIGLGDSVPAALLKNATLSGVVLHDREIRYTFGELEWAGQQLFGWRFEIDVSLTGSL